MKTKPGILRIILLIINLFVFINIATAQTPTYKLIITNETQPDSSTYEFDLFLLSTDSLPLQLADLQFGIGYDVAILNGGNQTHSIVTNVNGDSLQPAPSELLPQQVPNSLPIGGTASTFPNYPGVYYRFFNCAARTPPGAGNGTFISSVANGCNHPGTRIARFRITNSVPFLPNSTCKHIFSESTGPNRLNTVVEAYESTGLNKINITNNADNVNYDYPSTCVIQPSGIVLNSTTISVPELNSSADQLVIFPQPSTGEVTIRLKQGVNIIHHFNLYDLQGKFVLGDSFSGDHYRFDVDMLSGIYFIDFPEENIHAKMVVE